MSLRAYRRMTPLPFFVIAALLMTCSDDKAAWDAKVKEMCEKDGGVAVYEKVALTQEEYKRLGGIAGTVPVPSRAAAPPNAPYVADTTISNIRDDRPRVYRRETKIVRTSDGKVLSRQITYGRIGGDVPSPAHHSSFGCETVGIRLDVEKQTFEIGGDAK